MGKDGTRATNIDRPTLERYLARSGYQAPKVLSIAPLGASTQEGLKAYGYGRPLHVRFESRGATHQVVVRTMAPDPFGHARRADRAAVQLLAFDTFNACPSHVRALDIGAFDEGGEMMPMGRGELFFVTEYVDGVLYAHDLHQLAGQDDASPRDVERAEALATYLADLHRAAAPQEVYCRSLRDTVGSGEGIFGQTDSYPSAAAVVAPERLLEMELQAVRWRWRLRHKAHRARKTHGDFHPFNILFREGTDFSVLDCSRGGEGEPADDVTCLTVNYIFFALAERGELCGPYRTLWKAFWHKYLEQSGDEELLEVVAPFFTWRLLVVASPLWYPDLDPNVRERLLQLAERLLSGAPFHPERIDELLP